jgi:hypothetical protein
MSVEIRTLRAASLYLRKARLALLVAKRAPTLIMARTLWDFYEFPRVELAHTSRRVDATGALIKLIFRKTSNVNLEPFIQRRQYASANL